MIRFSKTLVAGFAAVGLVGVGTSAHSAAFVAGADPTTTFDNLLLDDARTGGGDTSTQTSFGPSRYLDFETGNGPLDITINGIGFTPRGGTSTVEETITVTVTYFGADDNFGATADNLVLGSQTATLQYGGSVATYSVIFDDPITGTIDGENNRFQFLIQSTGNLRLKSTNATTPSVSGQTGLWLSVGGTAVPEPGSLALLGLGSLLIVRRRR